MSECQNRLDLPTIAWYRFYSRDSLASSDRDSDTRENDSFDPGAFMATRGDYIRTRDQVALAKTLPLSNSWLIFADTCEDAAGDEVPLASELAWLCRAYYNFESLRRAGMAPSREDSIQFGEYNTLFEMPEEVDLEERGNTLGFMSGRIGPFYTKLHTGLALSDHFYWLENEPIRDLELFNLTSVDDLGMILRNHRMEWLSTIRLRFQRRGVNPAHVAELIKGMTASWLNCFELFIHGVDDRLNLIRSAFNMLRAQPKRGFLRGAKLYINNRPEPK